jgi:phage tail sheath protein FI
VTAPLAPGVYREFFATAPRPAFRTGVPAFLGLAAAGPVGEPVELTGWAEFERVFGARPEGGFLAPAVHGFFRVGGALCTVVRLADGGQAALARGLAALEAAEGVDLVCVPEVTGQPRAEAVRRQQAVLRHCERVGGRFAILDSVPGDAPAGVLAQRRELAREGDAPGWAALRNAALYHPWLVVEGWDGAVPPCGHVAGVYAVSDARVGVHKPPANERLDGVLDLAALLDDAANGVLNAGGINCIRAFPGRGVRVWGARSLSGADAAPPEEAAWKYVSVRRTVLTLGRWIDAALAGMAFEPADPGLWARIVREVGGYLSAAFRRGALQGRTAEEAYFVRCDAALNPPEVRAAGMVVVEVGLAPAVPNEFIVVRFARGADDPDTPGPTGPA